MGDAASIYLGDKWLAASSLQKAIRRGDVEVAQNAAAALLKMDRSMFWRRLACTAIEDVGPNDVELIVEALTATRHTDLEALIARLCIAPKERATDYLVSIIQYSPDLAGVRSKWAGELSNADYPHEILTGSDIEVQSVLAWHRTGSTAVPGDGLPQRVGNPAEVFEGFRNAGIPCALVDACENALRKLRNPLPVLYPLLFQAIHTAKRTAVENEPSGPSALVHGIPLYALGGHTRLGKRAISAWVNAGRKLTLSLAALAVPTKCWRQAAELGVFHVESAVTRPTLRWDARERPVGILNLDMDPSLDDPWQWDVGECLRARAIRADFTAIGFPVAAVPAFLEAVAENLPHLDRIRTAVIEREVANQQSGRQARWNF